MTTDRLRHCLDARVSAGVFSRDKANMLEALVKDLEVEYRNQMAPDLAGAAAAAEAVRLLREGAARQKRQTALQIMAQTRVLDDARAHPKGFIAGAMSHLVRDMHGVASHSNVSSLQEVVLGELMRRFENGLSAYRSKAAGLVQDTIGVRNMVRELFGEATNDPTAKSAAASWTETAKYAADRYVAAGGDLAEREDWHLPQIHDAARLRAAGFEKWRDTILPLLDERTWQRLEWLRRELAGKRGQVDAALAAATKERDRLTANARGARTEFEQARSRHATADRRIRDLEKQLGEIGRQLEAEQARAFRGAEERRSFQGLDDLRAAERRQQGAERRAEQIRRAIDEIGRELETNTARFVDSRQRGRGRRIEAVERLLADTEGLLPDPAAAREAARRGDAQAGKNFARADENAVAMGRLRRRREDLQRQLDVLMAEAAEAARESRVARATIEARGENVDMLARRAAEADARAKSADTAVNRLSARRSELERQLGEARAARTDADEAIKGKSGQWQAYEEDLRAVEQRIRDLSENRRIIGRRIDGEPGQISPAHRDEVLRYIFDQITSNVPRDLMPGTMSVSRHNARRFFVFRDADSWLAYNDAFGAGRGGAFDLLTGHMESMARDIALTEVLGPKHGATARLLVEEAYKAEGGLRGLALVNPVRAVESAAALERTYDVVSGWASGVKGELLAGIAGGVRSWLAASKLGSAVITAVPSDAVTLAWAAKANGMSVMKTFRTALRQMNPASDADRQLALRMGIVAHTVMDTALGVKRFQDEIVGQGLAGRAASIVIRAQGMAAWTQALKNAFMMEMMGHIADNVGRPLAEVSKPLRRMLERRGFTAADWDVIRAAPLFEAEGARFFDAANVSDRRLGERLMEAIIEERAFAVLEPDARVRQLTTAGLRRGTVWGEVARSAWMFKSFAVTMATTHMMRAAWQSTAMGKLGYFGAFTALLTVAGAISIQAKQMLAGKDPRDMSTKEFWSAAMLQGGALGYFGDFLNSALARDGRDFASAMMGPALGLVPDALRLVSPRIREFYEGEPSRFGAELARFVRFNTPVWNLWYSRLVLERAVMDQVQSLVDPDYRRSFARMERRARKDFGQRFWYRPGNMWPDRAPDLGAALPR